MRRMRGAKQPLKVFAQTALSFRNLRTLQRTDLPDSYPTSWRATPEIPREVWDLILSLLPNVSLKAVRLTCSAWSDLGTDLLFDTVCLDSFEESWTNLKSLSFSPFAHLVHTIQVRPLRVPRECRNADAWYETYSNILDGLSHSESVELHHKFQTFFKQLPKTRDEYLLRLGQTSATCLELSNLVHCHRVIFSDDSDVNSRCRDPYLRFCIQRDQIALNKVGTWGLKPSAISVASDDWYYRKDVTVFDCVLRLLKSSPTITRLELRIWNFVWDPWFDARSTWSMPVCQHLTHLGFIIKFCPDDIEEDYVEDHDYPERLCHGLGTTFGAAYPFPNLKSLHMSTTPSEPDSYFNRYRKQRLLSSDHSGSDDDLRDLNEHSDDAVSSISSSPSQLSSNNSRSEFLPSGLSKLHFRSVAAHLRPKVLPLNHLGTVELSNLCIDVNSLLVWLISRCQNFSEVLNLSLHGYTVLYGMNPSVFLAVMQSLLVHLQYDEARTIYYEYKDMSDNSDFTGRDMKTWSANCSPMQESSNCYTTYFRRGLELFALRKKFHDANTLVRRLCDIELLPSTNTEVIIDNCPAEYKARYLSTGASTDYYYCTWSRTDDTIKFAWHAHELHLRSDVENSYLLLKAHTRPLTQEDYEDEIGSFD